jgi:hypothetical protein
MRRPFNNDLRVCALLLVNYHFTRMWCDLNVDHLRN